MAGSTVGRLGYLSIDHIPEYTTMSEDLANAIQWAIEQVDGQKKKLMPDEELHLSRLKRAAREFEERSHRRTIKKPT